MTPEEKYKALRTAVMGVIACFKSTVNGCDGVGCINDHHPSCHKYLVNVLAKVDEEEEINDGDVLQSR